MPRDISCIGPRGTGRTTRSVKEALEVAMTPVTDVVSHIKNYPKVKGPISLAMYLLTRFWWWKYPKARIYDHERNRYGKSLIVVYNYKRVIAIRKMIQQHRGEWYPEDATWINGDTLVFPGGGTLTIRSSQSPIVGLRIDSYVVDHDVGDMNDAEFEIAKAKPGIPFITAADRFGYTGTFTSYELQRKLRSLSQIHAGRCQDGSSVEEGDDDPDETGA